MLIQLNDVYKIYGEGMESEVRALDGVSLTVDRGEFVAIVGQSGSGKSTAMNIIGCLDVPTSGTYRLGGVDVSTMDDDQQAEIRNKMLGFIFQQYNLIPKLTVLENVELPLLYAALPAEERRRRALEALDQRDRLLFYRKYYYCQSTAQIARELGLTERAVEGRLYRLRQGLRQKLGGELDD